MKNSTGIAALGLCIGLVLASAEVVAQGAPTAEQLQKLAAQPITPTRWD